MTPPEKKTADNVSESGSDGIAYQSLNAKRSTQLGQVTKIHNQVKFFDPLVSSIHVLRNHREYLNLAQRNHQAIINDMMDHADADFTQIEVEIDKFRVAHSEAMATLEEKMETAKAGSKTDNLAVLQGQFDAVVYSLYEVKTFIADDSSATAPVSELRFRMKDLREIQTQYLDLWQKIFVLSETNEQELLKSDRAKFNADFYKTLGWFDSRVNSAAVSPSSHSTNAYKSTMEPKLPKIELPTYDGKPVNWVSFRDSFKALVHDVPSISKTIKFRYLKSAITDKFSPISHLLETESGYDDAWIAVMDYYDDERCIADSHFAAMLSAKPMESETHDELQRILNEFSLHTASLERMKNEKQLYGAFIAHLVLQRLDAHTRDLWETENRGDLPFWSDLQQFLKDRRKALSTLPASKSPPAPQPRNFTKSGSKANGKTSNTLTSTKSSPTEAGTNGARGKSHKCHLCSGDHRLHNCQQFLSLSIPQRLSKVKELKLCSNCLSSHAISECKSKFKCRLCQQRHHTMLHLESNPPRFPSSPNSSSPRSASQSVSSHAAQVSTSSLQPDAQPFLFPPASCLMTNRKLNQVTLLQTAMIQIRDVFGEWHSARAFLDSGSDSNYITRSAAEALKIPLEPTDIQANGLGGNKTVVIRHKVSTQVGTATDSFSMELLVTNKITNPTPAVSVDAEALRIPEGLQLADPTFHIPGRIDILIGNEHYGELLRDGIIKLSSGPTLLNSVFGWIFSGSVPQSGSSSARENRSSHFLTTNNHHNTLAELRIACEKFYKLEDYRTDKEFLTDEQTHCENVFSQTHTRVPQGSISRFKVFLPLKEVISQLANNYRQALALFFVLEKRLQKNEKLREAYVEFMRDYIERGHATEVDISREPPNFSAFYFPHHAVENPESSTTPTRVVFNGSAKTPSGISFNDAQCVGPQIQSDAFTLSLVFRLHTIVIKADVSKMYRMIDVAEQQRRYQRIIWRENPDEPLKIFELNTVTYGTASASFQATRCLKELGIINREKFPKAAEEIINRFYVDDYISGAETVGEATKIAGEVCQILDGAGMTLRKFNSNNQDFLQTIPEERREAVVDGKLMKALGIYWDPEADLIRFVVHPIKCDKITRRIILSEIHRIYDPEGLLGPVTFRFKLFMKRVFKLLMPWDAPVPATDAEKWIEIASQFPQLSEIQIPRQLVRPRFTEVQLHGFCDASIEGYGICIYVRSRDASNNTLVRLVCSKSRVAPNEFQSIARLELCGAVMLANMMTQVCKALEIVFSKKICWSDSAIALQWLKKLPSQLQTFVANRVSEIQELSTDLIWRHIPGKDNPADLISRGLTPLEIIDCPLWWNGPDFLSQHESKWPKSMVEIDPEEPTFKQEFKKIESLALTSSTSVSPEDTSNSDVNPFIKLMEDSSETWSAKRKLAFITRFVFNARAKSRNLTPREDSIKVSDMIDAEHAFARIYQRQHFPTEFDRCSRSLPIPNNSRIKNLDPIWDSNHQLMRVGGRLDHAEHCSDDQKHPIILPNCYLARLLIRETHQHNLHAGQEATNSFIRMRYWPLRSKHVVRQEVRSCVKCFRVRPTLHQQFMGQLPVERITPAPPFTHTGVDYCGPFDIKLSKLRTAKTGKAYVAVFVCMATKAIHLEIVTDLTTASFFAAFDKFTARRGLPSSMHSDNGTTFVGASNSLRELHEFLTKESTQHEIRSYLQQLEVEWHFIPARAPAQGGLWEAGVKSFKHHFYRVATNALLTYEEFDRLKSRIEAILNSRPLTALSNDPSDMSALTAGHFLIGRPLNAKPNPDFTPDSINRLQRWDRVVQMQQHFWQRWSRDYLHQLQVRTKNYKSVVPVTEGQLVLMHVDNAPPMHWPLGRITRIYPGKDGVTRVASIKTQYSKDDYQRPVEKLALLPISPDDDQLEPAEHVRN